MSTYRLIVRLKDGLYRRYPSGFALPKGWGDYVQPFIVLKGFVQSVYTNEGNLTDEMRVLPLYTGSE